VDLCFLVLYVPKLLKCFCKIVTMINSDFALNGVEYDAVNGRCLKCVKSKHFGYTSSKNLVDAHK